jgi:hypothetical protein
MTSTLPPSAYSRSTWRQRGRHSLHARAEQPLLRQPPQHVHMAILSCHHAVVWRKSALLSGHQVLTRCYVAFADSEEQSVPTKVDALLTRPLQHRHVAAACSFTPNPCSVPRTPMLSQLLQHCQMTTTSCCVTHLAVPLEPLTAQILQYIPVPIVRSAAHKGRCEQYTTLLEPSKSVSAATSSSYVGGVIWQRTADVLN